MANICKNCAFCDNVKYPKYCRREKIITDYTNGESYFLQCKDLNQNGMCENYLNKSLMDMIITIIIATLFFTPILFMIFSK